MSNRESVWDYPRPPRLEKTDRRIRVVHQDVVIASTTGALRVLETSHPPTYYIPPQDVRTDLLRASRRSTVCEWKGQAGYWDLVIRDRVVTGAAWSYSSPNASYRQIAHYFAFYVHKMDGCYVDEEKVEAQPGSFYGGWITAGIVGPFKGAQGTTGW